MRYKLHTPESVTKGIEPGEYEIRAVIDGLDAVLVIAMSSGYTALRPEHYSLLVSSPAPVNVSISAPTAAPTAPAQPAVPTDPAELPKLREITSNSEVWHPDNDDLGEELKKLGLD